MPRNCQLQNIQGCQPDSDGRLYFRCVKCGRVFGPHYTSELPQLLSSGNSACPQAESPRAVVDLPSYAAMGLNFAKAWMHHVATGREVVSAADVLATFRICSACEFYSDVTGQCGLCGCYINLLHGGQGLNMLEWANEQCPHNPPFWTKSDRLPIKPIASGLQT